MSSKNQIRVRTIRASDVEQVRSLFMLCMAHGPGAPGRNALRHHFTQPSSYFAYAILLVGFLLDIVAPPFQLRDTLGWTLILGSCVYLGLLFHTISSGFLSYCNQSMKEDLADIPNHYKLVPVDPTSKGSDWAPAGASGFWVAEVKTEKGYEVVGSVAMDDSSAGEPGTGELRRMLVSPYHRRRGIGAKLSEALLAHAKEHKLSSLVLTTTAFQPDARRLYERGGWKLTSTQNAPVGRLSIQLVTYRMDLS